MADFAAEIGVAVQDPLVIALGLFVLGVAVARLLFRAYSTSCRTGSSPVSARAGARRR